MSPQRSPRRPPTIRDVAAEAGVGIATASRALTAQGYASPEVRARVAAAARKLRYAPSRAARALRGGASRVIGVLVPDLGAPVYVEWLRAAGEVANEAGYVLQICDARRSPSVARTQLRWLLEERVGGLLLAGVTGAEPALAAFRAASIPMAPDLPARTLRRGPRHREEAEGAREGFLRLVELGHRSVAYFAFADRMFEATVQRLRADCLRETWKRAVRCGEVRIEAVSSVEECMRRAGDLARAADGPTAFVAGAGELTAPILGAINRAGKLVPRDASLLGFGEGRWEGTHCPAISVVRYDYTGLAAALTRLLVARMEGRPEPELGAFPTRLHERESLGPAPTPTVKRGRHRKTTR